MDRRVWVLIASGTLAATLAAPVLAADTGFYVGAALGHAEQNGSASRGTVFVSRTELIGPLYPDRVDEVDNGDTAWSAVAGYQFTPYLAAEVEYIDMGTVEVSEEYSYVWQDPRFGYTQGSFTRGYTSRITGPAVSVLGSLPLGDGLEVFLRGGVFFAEREVKPLAGTSDSTTWLGGAGVAWTFASRWTVRAEYQLTGNLDAAGWAPATDTRRVALSVLFRF